MIMYSLYILRSRSMMPSSLARVLLTGLRRYINSPRIEGFIDITDATLSLATCCIWYLCQGHHCPWIEDEGLNDNIIAGDYRLHYYAATTWLELVERYLRLNGSRPPSELLVSAL